MRGVQSSRSLLRLTISNGDHTDDSWYILLETKHHHLSAPSGVPTVETSSHLVHINKRATSTTDWQDEELVLGRMAIQDIDNTIRGSTALHNVARVHVQNFLCMTYRSRYCTATASAATRRSTSTFISS